MRKFTQIVLSSVRNTDLTVQEKAGLIALIETGFNAYENDPVALNQIRKEYGTFVEEFIEEENDKSED